MGLVFSRNLPWLLMVIGGIGSVHSAEVAHETIAKIDVAIGRGVRFLVERQSADGAWRSDVYGAFKEGDALTPLVAATLTLLPSHETDTAAIEKSRGYLRKLTAEVEKRDDLTSLVYPLYTAANATIVFARVDKPGDKAICEFWVRKLRALQYGQAQGWTEADLRYGGWGYANEVPRKGRTIGPPAEPNLSATRFALSALTAAGREFPNEPAIQAARTFVGRCQNYRQNPKIAPDSLYFDDTTGDGGFFFLPTDPDRNKAGKSTAAPSGLASYGSSTADGLIATAITDNRQSIVNYERLRAVHWFQTHLEFERVPGEYTAEREAIRNGVYYYYLAAVAEGFEPSYGRGSFDSWPMRLSAALLTRQQKDGSWKNDVVEQREEDPLIATSFALQALASCRKSLASD